MTKEKEELSNLPNRDPGTIPESERSKTVIVVGIMERVCFEAVLRLSEDRFNKLKEKCLNELSSVNVKNCGWESGRLKAQLADSFKGDASNIFTLPSMDALLMRNYAPESKNLATAEELTKISAKVQALGAPEEYLAEVFWDFCMYCATAVISPNVNPKGTISVGGKVVTREMVVAVIKDYTTLRQFCLCYAPVVCYYMLLNEQPPANWDAKVFTENTKYSAFDTFDDVNNKAAIKPLEGLISAPNDAERIDFDTHKKLALAKNSQNSRYPNTSAEVTGVFFGCFPKIIFRENRC
nr:CP [Garlic latent virus]